MSVNFKNFRKLFPVTNTDIYLNHAAISPLSSQVVNSISTALSNRSAGSIDTFQVMLSEKEELKKNIATLIKTDPSCIALIGNTSEGLNWFVNGLHWQKGDRILLIEDEFPSNVYPFMNLESLGVEIDFVPTREGMISIDDIEKHITRHTRLLSISFVEFFSGFRNDLEKIGQICDHKNILFSVDGIQGVGAIPLDVIAAKIDFLSNGGHKWLMGPMGCGFMYIKPELCSKLRPVFAGWLSVKDSWNFTDYNLDFIEGSGRFEIGTPNFLGIVGARASTNLLVEAGPENILIHLLYLGDLLIDGLEKAGLNYLGSREEKHRSGIYTFNADRAEELFNYLKDNHVHVSLRQGAIRISQHFYNQPDEINKVIELCRKFYQI
jgi:selenocysteine lyase/cysteine desulfurase